MNTGLEATTSPVTGKEYISPRGVPFELFQHDNGLWGIRMLRGGSVPRICDGKYTNRFEAEKELISYLRKRDKLGFAVYPTKD